MPLAAGQFTFKNISVKSPESFTLYLEIRCFSLPASKECVEEIKLTSYLCFLLLILLMCCLFQINQSVPNGKPNLVSPSLAKLDLEALKRDIPNKYPQYAQAPSEYWKAWLRDVESKIISVPDNYIWPVDKVKTASRTAPPPSAAQLSGDLLELKEREIQPTPEVSML